MVQAGMGVQDGVGVRAPCTSTGAGALCVTELASHIHTCTVMRMYLLASACAACAWPHMHACICIHGRRSHACVYPWPPLACMHACIHGRRSHACMHMYPWPPLACMHVSMAAARMHACIHGRRSHASKPLMRLSNTPTPFTLHASLMQAHARACTSHRCRMPRPGSSSSLHHGQQFSVLQQHIDDLAEEKLELQRTLAQQVRQGARTSTPPCCLGIRPAVSSVSLLAVVLAMCAAAGAAGCAHHLPVLALAPSCRLLCLLLCLSLMFRAGQQCCRH